jgi:hypothetical protein
MLCRLNSSTKAGLVSILFIGLIPNRHLYAQPVENVHCPEQSDDPERNRKIAGEWFSKGTQHVLEKQYAEAEAAFRCSYEVVAHPATLLNLAKASKLAGHLEKAAAAYQEFIEKYPSEDKAALARMEFDALSRGFDDEGDAEPPDSALPSGADREDDTSPDRDTSSSVDAFEDSIRGNFILEMPPAKPHFILQREGALPASVLKGPVWRWPNTLLIAIGAVGVLTGVGFGAAAIHQAKATEEDGITLDTFNERRDKKNYYIIVTSVTGSVGVAAILSGIIMALVEQRHQKHLTKMPVAVGVSFGQVTLEGTFFIPF